MSSTVFRQVGPNHASLNCRHCSNRIFFVRPQRLGSEIGLTCANCGRRLIYTAADLAAVGDPIKGRPVPPNVAFQTFSVAHRPDAGPARLSRFRSDGCSDSDSTVIFGRR
jgi:hypothetical protein